MQSDIVPVFGQGGGVKLVHETNQVLKTENAFLHHIGLR